MLAAHFHEYPLTPDECAAIAEAAECWCRRWSTWQSPSITDIARHVAARLCRSAPTFVRRTPTDLTRHGEPWALRVQQGPGLTLREPVREGQHYLVVTCDDHPRVRHIWALWNAEGRFFSREAGSDVRRFARHADSHVEDVLRQATYRLARVSMVPAPTAAATIAQRTCPQCGRQASAIASVAREAVIFACRVCGHQWTFARAGGGADA